jgi:hypothetical protein
MVTSTNLIYLDASAMERQIHLVSECQQHIRISNPVPLYSLKDYFQEQLSRMELYALDVTI